MGNYSIEQRRKLLKQGKALPPKKAGDPPRFPIDDGGDVTSAVGLARTDEERRHVYRHAKRLGQLGKIPSNWRSDGSIRS